jgi:hypothetical protein
VQPCRGWYIMYVEVGPSADTYQTNKLQVDKILQVQELGVITSNYSL